MLDPFSRMQRIAPHYQTLLVTGDIGTGDELVARTTEPRGDDRAVEFSSSADEMTGAVSNGCVRTPV
jgi:DNA-binding NtrC family response regulator